MSVFIFEPDAFDKICQVEGEEYIENQKNFGNSSFDAFKRRWEEVISKKPSLKEEGKDMAITMGDGNGAIYGLYGWNRYVVYYSGEIVFLESQAVSEKAIKRAREVGFRTEY